jgi:tetratricopeptide (TPR) repeat protein
VNAYSIRDVERLLGIRRSLILQFVAIGLLEAPAHAGREPRLSFRDLVLLRTATRLLSLRVPIRRLKLVLRRLRADLPRSIALSSVRIDAVGTHVVLRQGSLVWQLDSGQYLLDFDDDERSPAVFDPEPATCGSPLEHWLRTAEGLEASDVRQAERAYREALRCDPSCIAAYVNLGCLLQQSDRNDEALAVYRQAVSVAPSEALLHFNLGIVLEDLRRLDDAATEYSASLSLDPRLADAHFNLARILEEAGQVRRAIRHLATYRKLTAADRPR